MNKTGALNIATLPLADKVQRYMMASYYAVQLDELQGEAKRLGYYFAQADLAAPLPPVLAECLARATEYRRRSYLNPKQLPEDWERLTRYSLNDGYAQEHLRSMLAALSALGVQLRAGPAACARLAAEECRQRQAERPPPHRAPEYAEPAATTDEAALFELADSLLVSAAQATTP